MEFAETREREQLEAFLRRDPGAQVYALADLDEFFWPETTWFRATQDGELRAFCLLLEKLALPIVYAVCPEDHAPTGALLEWLAPRLPRRFFMNLGPGLERALPPDWALDSHGEHCKLLLSDPARAESPDDVGVVPLGLADRAELEAFYRDEAYTAEERTGRFLTSYMMQRWPFFGIREGERLVCAGGTHVFSARYRVAALGNIATRPDRRGRGLARAVTARLCRELLPRVDHLGLNVGAENHAALRCYQQLGFTVACRYQEGIVTA